MSVDIAEPASPVSPQAATKNVFQRLIGVVFSPDETFRDIVRKPNVVAPLIVLVLIGYAMTFVLMPIIDWEGIIAAQTEQMRAKNPNIDNATMDNVARMTRLMGKIFGYAGPIFGVIIWLIVAGVLFLAFRLMGGEGTFGQAFGVTIYAWVPQTIFGIVMAIVARARGTFNPVTAPTLVKSNLAFLVDMKEHPGLFNLLGSIDIFNIWTLLLLTIGFAIMSRFSKAKAATIIITVWLLFVLCKSGLAALGGAAAKG